MTTSAALSWTRSTKGRVEHVSVPQYAAPERGRRGEVRGHPQLTRRAAMASAAPISEHEAALYDRQIRLWGLDAQQRFGLA